MNEARSLKLFTDRANDLISSKVILSERAISSLLKCIATNKLLIDCAMKSLAEFNYSAEFARARTIVTLPTGKSSCRLKAPPTQIRLFAFVLCLLTEFDTSRRSITDFLYEYYPSDNVDASFQQFVDQFLRPFRKAGETILKNIDPNSFNREQEQSAEKYFYGERIYISSLALDELSEHIGHIADKLRTETYFAQQDKADFLEIVKAFQMALHCKNPRLIKLMWISLSGVLAKVRSVEPMVKSIHRILIDNNLV